MEFQLTVLAGAKQGKSIPLKRDEFIIGRSSECTLRAGSDAISRRHCSIVRTETGWSASDLGSRNGTFLNDQRIKEPTPLKDGDEIRIGPLRFRIDSTKTTIEKTAPGTSAKNNSHGLKHKKRPPVKDVADVAARTADPTGANSLEDDISHWLLENHPSTNPMRDTISFKVNETTAVPPVLGEANDTDKGELEGGEVEEGENPSHEESSPESSVAGEEMPATAEEVQESDSQQKSWTSLFGTKGKTAPSHAKPGKLPTIPKDKSKDSCEAAAEILREMTRRR